MSKILGISCFFHDSAAAYIQEGKIVNAFQEERFSRIKHDDAFPKFSILKILEINKLKLNDFDAIVFYEKPFQKFVRLIETYVKNAPKGFTSFKAAIPIWVKEKLYMKKMIYQNLSKIDKIIDKKIFFSEHHLSHAASSFYPSPFTKAAVLVVDGVGEWATTSLWLGENKKIRKLKQINFPDSLGLLYSSFTQYLGFKVNSGEYKLMGLAPYGKPIYKNLIYKKLIKIYDDSSYSLNIKYFDFETGLSMINNKFQNLFGQATRKSDTEKLNKFHADVAASIQQVTEEIYFKILNKLYEDTKCNNLCISGGVALNCVANGKIKQKTKFKNIWIQPASGDAGCSIGAALAFYYKYSANSRKVVPSDSMQGSYLGNEYSEKEIKNILNKVGAVYEEIDGIDNTVKKISKLLAQGNSIGWFQGKMEFGPRALGNRSILADPRNPYMQKKLNLKIKFRESFRPFAPSILEEQVSNYFDYEGQSSYMLMVARVRKELLINKKLKIKDTDIIDQINNIRSKIPAITHIDYSARLHTVSKKTNLIYYKLLEEFFKITGFPILINTSFNIRGEPIVESPHDAFNCFMGTNLDYLVCGNYLLKKSNQKNEINIDYKNKFKLD